MSTSINE
jgi:hypothetical protein